MGQDLFSLKALAYELDKALKGARVDKIQQPEVDEFRFFVRTVGKNLCLCVSCNSGAPRIHLTNTKKQSPINAPNFLMILRKYLSMSNIMGVDVFNNDRIIRVTFEARTEMQDNATYYLFFEIMNRYSNIVFTDSNLKILEAVKQLGLDGDRDHVILRGLTYEPVTQPKTSYLTGYKDLFKDYKTGNAHDYILDNLSGFSGITVSEILNRANVDSSKELLDDNDKEKIINELEAFTQIETNGMLCPCIINHKDVYPIDYTILNGDKKYFDSMSEAFDELYSEYDQVIRNKARLRNFLTDAKRLVKRSEKNITIDLNRLKECEDKDKYKLYGELIVTYIYLIKRGDEKLTCLNYYNNEEITIPLDPTLSPSRNSNYYFNLYNKLKRAEDFTKKKLEDDKLMLDYAKSLVFEIENLPYTANTVEIEQELGNIQYKSDKSRQKKQKKIRREKPTPPIEYLIDGFEVLVGRNNLQNEELTFKVAHTQDIWMHAKNYHGSHLIIKTFNGEKPSENVLNICAEIVAFNQGASVEVDYTERKNVKRQPNGHPGQVIYVNYQTILAEPNEHKELMQK